MAGQQQFKYSFIAKDSEQCEHVCDRCGCGRDQSVRDTTMLRRVMYMGQEMTMCEPCMDTNASHYYENTQTLYTLPCHNKHTQCGVCERVRTLKYARVYNHGDFESWDWYCERCFPALRVYGKKV